MPDKPDNHTNFWQELKRRKVVRVIVGYLASAYVLLELTSIIAEPFGLPQSTIKLVFVLLCVGFIIAIYLSWIFDVTPEGIKKTESAKAIKLKEFVAAPTKRKLRVSDAIIGVLLVAVVIFAYPHIFKRNTLEKLRASGERISVAVMPFQNMTNDTTKNFWQVMIQDNLINLLTDSEELKVRQSESIISLLQNNNITNYASITPSIASKVSQKLDANIFVHGSINQIGTIIRLNVKLVDSKTEEIIKSFQKDGTSENLLPIIDTISAMVRDFLIISELKKGKNPAFEISTSTNSPEAYRYYSLGKEAFFKYDMPGARDLLLQAVSIDSGFTYAAFLITFTYSNEGNFNEAKKWCLRLYEKKDQMSLLEKTDVNRLYAGLFETGYDVIKYTKQLLGFDDQNPRFWYNLGNRYRQMYQFDNAIPAYEKSLEIYDKWNSKPLWILNYTQLGECYHATSHYKKERQLYKKAEKDFPDDPYLLSRQAILALSEGETKAANEYIEKYVSLCREYSDSEAAISSYLALIYSEAGILNKAEEYYRKALSLERNENMLNELAYFLIDTDHNVNEGMELVAKALNLQPDNHRYLHTRGWGLFKQGKYDEALEILQKSWDIRREKSIYSQLAYLQLEETRQALSKQNSE
jgi:tetratricopeptide (TPR) repeat protein/TolB-like protein